MSKWTAENIPDLSGKVALVTGANSGLGMVSAVALARKGASVIMASRNPKKGQAALGSLQRQAPGAAVEFLELDLASLEAIHRFGEEFNKLYDRLDILLNNAGVMALPRSETVDGFEMQLGTNHLGHFALTGLLLPELLKTPGSRVVAVSSMAHQMGTINFNDLLSKQNYSRWGAYGQSKLANLLFAFELQRRLEEAGATTISLAAHPGYSNTNLQHTTASAGGIMDKYMASVGNIFFAQPASIGALPQLYAATAPGVKGGQYYGPQFLVRGYPVEAKAMKKAYDTGTARKLFEVSEQLTGVKYKFQPVLAGK